jgi:hypothetical protein
VTVEKVTHDNDRGVIARGHLGGRLTEIVRYDRAGKFYAEWEGVDDSGRSRQLTDLNETIERVRHIRATGGEYFPGVARRVDKGMT